MQQFKLASEKVLPFLDEYRGVDAEEEQHRVEIRTFVAENSNFCSRHEPGAHITASAWITTPDRKYAMLLHHKKLNIWIQPGGHFEPQDISLSEASLRELHEETGLLEAKLNGNHIFDVDIHQIPARKNEAAHRHLDIRFWFVCEKTPPELSGESHDLGWMNKTEILQVTQDFSILRMVEKSMF